jgi:PIN domain nuclease of toxin-antitoxin system
MDRNMKLLLDTCALIWWTLDREKLSDAAAKAINADQREDLYISSISIWEIGIKIKNGKLDMGTDISDYTKRLAQLGRLSIIPVNEDIWIKNLELDWTHRDPADRTIVATAELHKLAIITADSIIAEYYPHTVW